MGRSSSRARIRAPCFRARTRAPCFRARIRATKRENKWAAAGGARGRARTCSARTALCDARVIPYAARTTLSGAPATFQARATRAKAILRRGIPLIPLIPLNPAESRFQFNFCRRCEPESDRDPGEKFVLARNSHRGLSLWTIDRLSQSFAACSRPRGSPWMPLSQLQYDGPGAVIAQAILRRPTALIAALCVAEVFAMTGFATYWSLLPVLQPAWDMNNATAGWLSGAFFGGYVLAVPFLTAMTDRVDARHVFILGAVLSAGALIGMSFLATGFWSALPWRVIAGAGLAGCYMPGLKVLTDRLPQARQARAVAFYTASFSIGTALSYALAGGALEWFGWRGAFLFAAAGPVLSVVAVVTLVAPRAPEAPAEERRHVLDFRPVLRSRETMGYIVAYAGHGAELFAMRSWIVPFLVFCLGSGGASSSTPRSSPP